MDRGLDTGTILFVLPLAVLASLQTGFYGPGWAGCYLKVWGAVVTFFIKKAYCYHLLIYNLIYMFCCHSHLVFLLSKQMLFSGLNTTWIS